MESGPIRGAAARSAVPGQQQIALNPFPLSAPPSPFFGGFTLGELLAEGHPHSDSKADVACSAHLFIPIHSLLWLARLP